MIRKSSIQNNIVDTILNSDGNCQLTQDFFELVVEISLYFKEKRITFIELLIS